MDMPRTKKHVEDVHVCCTVHIACIVYIIIGFIVNICKYGYFQSLLLLNKKYYISETFICSSEHVKGYISLKILSRSRDPQGQFQGQILGQEVKVPQHVRIFKMAADLESLLNTLSNNTNFVKIDPFLVGN